MPPTKPVTLGVLLTRCQVSSVHLHFDQHVAGEKLALGDVLLAALHLDHFFDRHQDLAEFVLHAGALMRSISARCTLFSKPE